MTLVDTTIWVEHLRRGSPELRALLEDERVLMHPFVIGELACGTLRNRAEVLSLLRRLPKATTAQHEEVLHLVEVRRLMGSGLGWVDAHLLASALLTGCALWTLDDTLARTAHAIGIPS